MGDTKTAARALLAAACIGVLLFAVYVGQLAGPFLFDDQFSITDNTTLRSLSLLNPSDDSPVAARPLCDRADPLTARRGLRIRLCVLVEIGPGGHEVVGGASDRLLRGEPEEAFGRWVP